MTIYAIEHIKDIGSGEMHAQLFRCSDGNSYVVKFMSNPLGRKAFKQSSSLALIDHADAFRKSNWNITSIFSRIDNMEVRWGQVYQEFVPYIDQKQPFQSALEKLDSIPDEQIAEIVDQALPGEWKISRDELIILLTYLIQRRENLRKIISQLKGFFPIWSSTD
ncbi:hypothetical protein BIV60_25715 [Bacillus sp. MUM 116]|uniref:hypothetical protein n=1 Tax=Bacillus sp. MUM 116 TaxID=1678002 RepID=UPI0008F5A9B9|nr:hypothetical protein [Bacillus sp. MUM 116]OIK08609.1 hypothetical protein BIV60_25715 [Bacillus sp. MUM 116]